MITAVSPEISDVLHAVYYRPSLSLTIPFEPKMTSKGDLSHILKLFAKEIERKLAENYSFEIVDVMIRKLHLLFNELNYSTHKKSIAIFLSPIFEKVLYLDIQVEQKIIIDEGFSIRDLVFNQQQQQQYLVLALSGSHNQIFYHNGRSFARILTDAPRSYREVVTEWREKVSNFTDVSSRREIIMLKFLRHIDTSLRLLLHAYKLPVFAMGPDRLLGHFLKLTKNREAIINVLYCDPPATLSGLSDIISPYLRKWTKLLDKQLLRKIDTAAKKQRLATGIDDVAAAANKNNIEHLIVEKSFRGSAGTSQHVIPIRSSLYDRHVQMKDVVDDIIGKVLDRSGEISFVENDVLSAYDHIAAIRRYE